MLLKHQIQDESALRTVLEIQSDQIVTSVINALRGTYAEYRIQRRRLWFGFAAPLVFMGLMTVVSEATIVAVGIIPLVTILAIPVYLYYLFRYLIPASLAVLRFSRQVDALLFVPAATLVGIQNPSIVSSEHPVLVHKPDESRSPAQASLVGKLLQYQALVRQNNEPILTQLRSSELITESYNITTVETVCTGSVRDTTITVAELAVAHETGSGKNRSVRTIFHGYFVACTLRRPVSGKTFVSTEQDKTGFGNLSFFSTNSPQETVLEWNDFENKLHVATTNEVEARYILTPDFMSDLYDWWQGQTGNIRLSFINDQMYILYPDAKVRIGKTIKNLDEIALNEHLLTIARPLMHVVHLVEDLRL